MVKKKLAILAAEDIEKKKKDEAEKNTKNVTAKDVADKFGVQLTTNDTGRKTTPGVNPVNNVVNATKQKVQALYQQKVADLVNRATAYAKQGSDYTLDLANSIINGAITSPGKGNTGKLDIDAIHDMTKANSEISRALSESGIFNIREIATNPVYAHLATQDYRTSLLPVLQDELTASLEADKANDAAVAEYESALRTLRADYTKQAEMAAQWKNFFSLVGEEATLEDKLRAAGIATGKTYDRSVFAGMDKYSAYAKKKELDDWYASLDAAALSAAPVVEEPEAPKYDSKTAGIQDEISTLEKYLNAHQTLEDLTAYARSNPDFATASVYTAPDYSNLSAWEQFFMPQMGGAYADNALYTYINTGDVDPYFSQNTGSADYYKRWEELGYDYMLDQDKEIWNVLRTMDPAKADAYLQALSQIYLLPTRAQGYRSWDETVATNGWTAVPAWIGSVGRGIDNILSVPQQLAEAWAGIDSPYSAAFDSLNRQGYTRGAQLGAIQEAEMPDWLKKVTETVYQGVSSAADNTARLLATGMNPTASLIAAGLQSASGSLYESAGRDDMSGAAKIVKAIGAGAIEVGTEKIGLDALFDMGKTGAKKYIGILLSELGEESVNTASEDVLEAVVAFLFDHEAEIRSGPEFWSDLKDTALTTLVSSSLMGGGAVISQNNATRTTGKAVQQQGDPERLLSIAQSMPEASQSRKIAQEITASTEKGKKMPLNKLGKLTRTMGAELNEKYTETIYGVMDKAIEERLVEVGSSPEAAKKNAPVIRKIANGDKPTIQERMGVEWDANAEQVVKELTREPQAEDIDRTGNKWVSGMKEAKIDATGEIIGQMVQFNEAMHTPSVGQSAKRAEEKAQAKRQKVGGKFAGKPTSTYVSFTDAQGKQNKGNILRVEDGQEGLQAVVQTGKEEQRVPLSALDIAEGEGIQTILEYIGDENLPHSMTGEEANLLLQTYKASGGGSAKTYIEGFEKNYTAGYSGIEEIGGSLEPTLAKLAYEHGKAEAEKDEKTRKARASEYKALVAPTAGWLGKVTSNAQVNGTGDEAALEGALEAMPEMQRTAAEIMIESGKALGVNVVLFESDGEIGDIQNGSFDAATHTVYYDVNAGANTAKDIQAMKDKGTLGYALMRVGGHELTHYLEAGSPEAYAKYVEAVKTALKSKGQDFAVLMREQIDKAQRAGRKLSMQGAVAEVVADASEYMLQDSKFTNNLDTTLKGKIKTFIQNFAQKIKDIFRQLAGGHKESAALRELKDGVYHYMENLQNLWDAGFEEILAKGTTEQADADTETAQQAVEGGVRYSDRDKNSPEQTSIKAQIRKIQEELNVMDVVASVAAPDLSQMNAKQRKDWVMGTLKSSGYKTEVQGFGVVEYGENQIDSSLNYLNSMEEVAAFLCLPRVLKRGIRTHGHENHKGRSFDTVTFAAPVEINGVRGNMAVVVKQIKRNLYKTHRILMPDGSAFSFDNKKAESTPAVGTPPMREAQETRINSANISIASSEEHVNPGLKFSERDLPSGITVRDYLAELKPTWRMNETEKILLKRYQDTLGKLREAEKNAAEQNEIIRTAPFRNPDGSLNDELTKAKNRWQIYRKQADRYARELARAERAEGFAGMLATGQQLVDKYLTGGYARIADASDELDAEIKGIEKKLKAIGATLQGADQSQKDAHARGLFNQTELNAAAKKLKDSYASRMSVKEISNRLALAYGEIYANNGEEGAKRFADAAKELAQDIVYSSKYRYRSETLTLIAEEVPVISLTETDKQEIRNAGLTISQYKRGIAPFVKVAEGASDLSSYVSNAEAYSGQIANILGTDTEGNLAMTLYNVIQAERSSEQAGTFEGMTEGESISEVMVDIMSANLPMTTDSSTIEYLRKEMLKQAGTSQTAAKAVEGAIQSAKTATRKASSLWHRAVQGVQMREDVIEYYRALDEQRRLMELAEQKKALSEQLKTDAAKKIYEQVEKQRTEYREREQLAREYRKSREERDKLRRRISRNVKTINALRVRETDQKHVPQQLQHVADLVMQTFTDSSLGRLAFPEEKLMSLSRRYRALRELANDTTYFWDDEIEADITNLQALGEAYSAMKNREGEVPSHLTAEGVAYEMEILHGVDDIVCNVLNMIDAANDNFLKNRTETFSEFANKTGEKLRAHDDHKVYKGWRGKLQNMLDELIVKGNMTPIYFFEHLQNQEMLDVFNELRDGQNLYAQIVAEGKAFMESTRAKHNYGAWVNDGKLTMKTGQGHTIELTREEAAEIYAIAKREAANKLYQTEHLLYGGFQYKNIAEKLNEDGKTQQKNTPHQLDKADIARIGEWLTAEQKAYADELVGFLSTTMADYGNQASMDMYGYKKFTEQYYIPFHTSAEQRFLKGDEGPQGENAGTGRVKNSGFTKKLQHKANQTLLVGGISDTVADHIHKMAAYAAMVQPIENMKRLLNHQVLENDGTSNTIRALIGQKYGQAAQDYLMQLLKDANGATMSDHRASGLTDKLVGAFKRGAVMASASVVLQQPTAMARAMAYINPKHFANNPFYRPSKGTWDELMKYSGTAVIKDMGKFDVGMGLTATQYILDENLSAIEAYRRLKDESKTKAGKAVLDRFMNWLTAAPGVADQWTWGLIWKAVKAEQEEMHPEMDKSSEAFLNLCGARFDDVIDHTQVYDSVLTRSDLMRSTNSLHKMATSFMSEPTLSLNMLYDALTGKHTGKQRGAIIGGVVASQVLAGALAALVQAWNDDDDERNWLEKYADRATGNILDNLNPLGMIPYVSDIISIFEGYDVERPDMSVITDIYNYSKKFVSSFENGGPTWKETENFVGTLANLLGIPAKNISREVRRTWNMITKTDWSAPDAFGVGQAVMGNLPGYSVNKTTYYQRITTALIRGETQLAEDYKAYMLASQGVDEDKLTQGIRTAYKDAYEKGGIDKDAAIAFLLENNLVTGDTEEKRKQSAFQYVDKWEEGTDGYSAYNTLKDAYAAINFSEIEKAWKELTNNGYTDKQVKEQSRTLLKKLVQDGSITTGQATQLLKKWCPYAKDSDNTDKPKEWLKTK